MPSPAIMDTQEHPADSSSGNSNDDAAAAATVTLSLTHHGTVHEFELPGNATLSTLNEAITTRLSIPAEQQKFMVAPRVGLLRPPYKDPELGLSTLADKKIQLLAPLQSEVDSLAAASSKSQARQSRNSSSVIKPAKPARNIDPARAQADATYTFGRIEPLGYLPAPERSRRFLERLRDDAGIRAAMRAHRFRVGLLTEMDPAAHTTHESRTLGLNRNRGQVIELRLRTDAYDGYRDYKTIRKTLCHELAHNVWGDHDRNFWDLTNQIEKEVERADWTRGGRRLGEEEFYNPNDGGYEHHGDSGGLIGGHSKLGGNDVRTSATTAAAASSTSEPGNLSRREMMAKAAEERMKRRKETEEK